MPTYQGLQFDPDLFLDILNIRNCEEGFPSFTQEDVDQLLHERGA